MVAYAALNAKAQSPCPLTQTSKKTPHHQGRELTPLELRDCLESARGARHQGARAVSDLWCR